MARARGRRSTAEPPGCPEFLTLDFGSGHDLRDRRLSRLGLCTQCGVSLESLPPSPSTPTLLALCLSITYIHTYLKNTPDIKKKEKKMRVWGRKTKLLRKCKLLCLGGGPGAGECITHFSVLGAGLRIFLIKSVLSKREKAGALALTPSSASAPPWGLWDPGCSFPGSLAVPTLVTRRLSAVVAGPGSQAAPAKSFVSVGLTRPHSVAFQTLAPRVWTSGGRLGRSPARAAKSWAGPGPGSQLGCLEPGQTSAWREGVSGPPAPTWPVPWLQVPGEGRQPALVGFSTGPDNDTDTGSPTGPKRTHLGNGDVVGPS